MSDEDVVLYDVNEGVVTITLNRPDQLNAWTGAMGTAYFDALERAADDPEVKVIVVTGAGRGFCAGADMGMLQDIGAGGGGDGKPDPRTHSHATGIPKPIIAAINGACAGLGLVHALMADIRFAAEGAKFTTAFSRRGLIAEHGIAWMLPRLTNPSIALDLLMSGRVFLADEAKELGVVNRVVAPDDLMSEAYAYARMLADNVASTSMAVIKSQIWDDYDLSREDSLAHSNEFMTRSLKRGDFKEGVASFVKKRPPSFAGVTRSSAKDL